MGKRGRGEGTIVRRKDGRWEAKITVGYDPGTGKARRVSIYGRSRKEVAEKLAGVLAEKAAGSFVEPSKVTFGDWLDRWLKSYARPKVRATTYQNYSYIASLHLKPALGRILLRDLRPEHFQALYNEKLSEGLSGRTVRLIHTVAHASLKQAMREGLVARNVSEMTSPPRVERKEVRYLTVEQQAKFLDALQGDRLGPAFLLMLATGLRRGELLALRWEDVDLENAVLHVRRTLVQVQDAGGKWRLVYQEPKSKTGRRTIPLPGEVVTALRTHRARQAEKRLTAGEKYRDEGLVFATAAGGPIHPRNFTRSFYRILKRAGLEGVNLHALRHTFATRLLEANEHPKVVQELLGDSQISVVLDTYSHVGMDLKRRAVEKIGGMLAPKKNPSTKGGQS